MVLRLGVNRFSGGELLHPRQSIIVIGYTAWSDQAAGDVDFELIQPHIRCRETRQLFGQLVSVGPDAIAHLGILSAAVIAFALVGDLLLTPILLSSTQLVTLWDFLGLHLRNEVIFGSAFFQNLKPWQIKKIVLLGHIIEKATGQASLNLLATFLDETVPSAAAKRNKIIYVTAEEEEIVKKYLAWVRYQRKMEASVG